MHRQAVTAAIHSEHVGVAVHVAEIETHFGTPGDALDRRFGDAAVDDVDRAADGAGPVKQRGGAFQYLDLVGQEGLDRG
ncbi:hypothetical protein RLIN73S_04686 [Rhodanobacter lindaniclasticus]